MAGQLKPSSVKSFALIGEGDSSFSQIPCFTKARSLLSGKKICHVSCGATVSIVLASTRSGDPCVLEWGTSMHGERLTIASACIEDPVKGITAPHEMENEATSRTKPQNPKSLRHPTIVSPTMLPVGEIVRQIACGAHFVVAAIASGGCVTWGGQGGRVAHRGLGRGGCGDCRSCFSASYSNRSADSAAASSRPRREASSSKNSAQWVEDPLGRRGYEVTLLAAGDDHVVAVCQNTEVWAWGRGDCGQLGIGTPLAHDDTGSNSCRPARVLIPTSGDPHSNLNSGNSEAETISATACGRDHSAIVTRRGEVWTFGSGLYGQLGMGTIGERAWIPTRVDSLDGVGSMRADGTFTGMMSIACGAWHTVALSTTGDLYSWGWARFGALGPTLSSDDFFRDTRGELSRAQGGRTSRFSSSRRAGDAEVRPYPGLVLGIDDILERDDSIVSVGCGARYTLALTRKQRAFVWGQVSPMDGLDSDRNFAEARGRMGTSKVLFSRPRELEPSRISRCYGTENVPGVINGAEPCCQQSQVRDVKGPEDTSDAVDSSRWVVSTAGCGPWYLVLGIETRPREGYRADEDEESASLRSSPGA